MKHKKKKLIVLLIVIVILLISFVIYLSHLNFEVLNPKGTIAVQEKHLIMIAILLSLIVVLPVFIMLTTFAYRYRSTNKNSKYSPNWDKNGILETMWWVIPAILISILGYITWTSSHTLDPFKPLKNNSNTLNIEVISLDWKWLFIYPNQKIATLNYFQIPVNTNVTFNITSDAPMNSFWIPQLAGQIYSMPGMNTELHLSSFQTGTYRGLSANLSGVGFSSMSFNVGVVNSGQFSKWISQVSASTDHLSYSQFLSLAKPSTITLTKNYSNVDTSIYGKLINSYMSPVEQSKNINTKNSMVM